MKTRQARKVVGYRSFCPLGRRRSTWITALRTLWHRERCGMQPSEPPAPGWSAWGSKSDLTNKGG